MAELFIKDELAKRVTVPGGGMRHVKGGKGRFDLLPCLALSMLAKHYEDGASVYAARNWEKGIPLSEYIDSTKRHLTKAEMKLQDGENHWVSVLWNVICGYETYLRIQLGILPKDLDDLPDTFENVAIEKLSDILGEAFFK